MKTREWNDALNQIDYDIVEKFVEQKEALAQKKKQISANAI